METPVKDAIAYALEFFLNHKKLPQWEARDKVIAHFTKMGFGEEFVSVCIESTDIWWEA